MFSVCFYFLKKRTSFILKWTLFIYIYKYIYKYIYIRKCIGNMYHYIHHRKTIFYAVRWCYFLCARVFVFLFWKCVITCTHTARCHSFTPAKETFVCLNVPVWATCAQACVSVCVRISGVCKWARRRLLT